MELKSKLWNTANKLRDAGDRLPARAVRQLKEDGVEFSADKAGELSQFFVNLVGPYLAPTHVPQFLVDFICRFAEFEKPRNVCDPWPGLGFLVGAVHERADARLAVAVAPMQEYADAGKLLVPKVEWRVGDTLAILQELGEIDLVAGLLPMGGRPKTPLTLINDRSQEITLSVDTGGQILAAACRHLRRSGTGLFVVPPSFFFAQNSVLRRFEDLDLELKAAFALPPGTFAPFSNVGGYLVVVSPGTGQNAFVGQVSLDSKTNEQLFWNYIERNIDGPVELGRLVEVSEFRGFEALRASERMSKAVAVFGAPAIALDELAKEIRLGRREPDFSFPDDGNSIFVPLIGISQVKTSAADLEIKAQNYAQVVIDPAQSNARFVASFLNSELGLAERKQAQSGFIPKLNKQTLRGIHVFVPDLKTQKQMIDVERRIEAEENTLLGLMIETNELKLDLWRSPSSLPTVSKAIDSLSALLAGQAREQVEQNLGQWLEVLPFPLASILRAWQATSSQDYKTRCEHLLHFFEAAAEFLSVVFLSAYSSNASAFDPTRRKLLRALADAKLSIERATFGTWRTVVEFMAKQVRTGLSNEAERPVIGEWFRDSTLSLPTAFSDLALVEVVSNTNKMRNDWSGHGGVVGQEEAQARQDRLLAHLQAFREATSDLWPKVELLRAVNCRPRKGVFENEVAVLTGSNSEFLKEARVMATWLDVERIYLATKGSAHALLLLPFIQVEASPQSAKNACYFFNRMERGGARFISYHYADRPELTGTFDDAAEAIASLTEV